MTLQNLVTPLFILLLNYPSEAQQWQWAVSGGGSGSADRNIAITRDNSGNLIVTGEFETTCTFGTTTLTPIAAGNRDVFLAKYDSAGNSLWAIPGGGLFSTSEVVGVATDNNDNIWIAGNFNTTITFGGYTLNQTSNPFPVNPNNSFLFKFDPNGNCVMAKALFSKTACVIRSLKGDGAGNFVITGAFMDSTLFDAIQVIDTTPGIFLTKFNTNGTFAWAQRYGGPDEDAGFDVAFDPSGNILMTGVFKQTAAFGSNSVVSYGSFDIFLAKMDALGNNLWVKNAGATGNDQPYAVSCDNSGNSFITGFYYPTPSGMSTLPAHFGPFLLADNGAGNMFVAKYDTGGTIQWAKPGGGTQHDEGLGIAADANGNSYVTGFFYSQSPTTGPASFSGINLNSYGVADVFIVKFNKFGTGLFGQHIGGTGIDKGRAILASPNGDLVVAGNYTATIQVNTVPPTTFNSPNFYWRVFIAKYSGGSVGVSENIKEHLQLSVFPNPAQDRLVVSLLEKKITDYHFKIINGMGQVFQSFQNKSSTGLNDFVFDTSSLPSGNYFIRIASENMIEQKPFVVID